MNPAAMDSTTPVVVDTDVISFIFKDHHVAPAYQEILAGRSLTVSLITLAEIEYGMEAKNWGTRRRELMGRFLSRFKPLLPDIDTANQWARIKNGCEKKGRPISFPDAWIAAAALQLNIPLVTHNAGDFEAVEGLTILTATTIA
jgi:predicted nucleic acid-binding protein